MAFKRLSYTWCAHQAAIRSNGVCPQHEHIVSVVNIRHGDEKEVAEHKAGHKVTGAVDQQK